MLGKIWKKVLLLVLIVACLFNIVTKLIHRNSLKKELEATVQYFNNQITSGSQQKEKQKSEIKNELNN